MKIISKFYDYYDSALKHGTDKDLIFIRKNSEELVKNSSFPYVYSLFEQKKISRRIYKENWHIEYFYLGFCGKIYPVVKFTNLFGEKIIHFSYSLLDFEEFCKNNDIKIRYERSFFYSSLRNFNEIKKFFNEKSLALENLFFEKNVPLFIYKSSKDNSKKILELNPVLKDIQFYKLKDPFSCFQEISMFLGGVLQSPEKPMVTISNQDKISKHGFDKWSFRKKGKNSK